MATSIHPFSEEEIMAYLDGELPVEHAVAAAAHLKLCPECQRLAADLQSVSRSLLDWRVEAPEFEAPRDEVRVAAVPVPIWRRPWVLTAASVAVLLVIGIVNSRNAGSVRQAIRPSGVPSDLALNESMGSAHLQKRFSARGGALGGLPAASPLSLPAAEQAAPTGPMIVRTAELALTAKDFSKERAEVERLTNQHHGYIAQLQLSTPMDQGRSLDATLRVPAAQLDAFLSELKALGHVDSESQRGEDVTQRYVDVQARLANLRTTEQRLTEILRQRTGRLADVLAVEEQIDRVRGQIETTVAEQKILSDQIAFASVQLKIAEEYKASLEGDHISTLTRIRNAAVEGYRTVVDGALGVLLFLLSAGPAILIVIAIGFFPVRWAWRKRTAAQ